MIPRNLLEKYNQSLPRYTSYPPANYFTADFTSDDYRDLLTESNNGQPANISLYVHIPFCHKICFYCGCNSVKYPKAVSIENYIEALLNEIKMVKTYLDPSRKVSQLHFGGGTPNAIPVEYIERINELIFSQFQFIENPEIAIECHPAHLDEEYMTRLVKAGFNRFSLGIQDFDLKVLKTANREPSRMPLDQLTSFLRGLDSKIKINFDFIYGLPLQTPESFSETIKKALPYSPDRIVTFSYAHVPWFKKHQLALERAGLPDAETKLQIFEKAYGILLEAGYSDIGMDHYAKGNDELLLALKNNELHRNFQGYCTRRTTGQVYAFGVSSISQLHNSYIQNTKDIGAYINSIDNNLFPVEKGYKLNFNEMVIRDVINQLMCNRHMHWQEIASTYGVTVNQIKEITGFDIQSVESLVDDNLIELGENTITITNTGRFFIRNIAVAFDPAMANASDKKFSKSI
ncbi:MAG TPA: oxygen-independent coproporphyrinogen III oxidase [Lentimicrobium sp.]|nr:oxygen-independent coproporphyrinogen III oxidase [Lentimicrobium sp.]